MQISFDVYLSCALMRYTSPHDISEKMLKTNNAVLVSTYLDVEKGMKVRFTSKPGRSDYLISFKITLVMQIFETNVFPQIAIFVRTTSDIKVVNCRRNITNDVISRVSSQS